ncbi:MAG: hypothetical protein C0490_10565 [Marivirga sp.]|nr:hypothetical protein [Marivirga sp.]
MNQLEHIGDTARLVVYFLDFRFQLGEHSFHVTLRILVDIDLLTENILARHGQVDEGLTVKVAISELLTKFETKQRTTTKMFMQCEGSV